MFDSPRAEIPEWAVAPLPGAARSAPAAGGADAGGADAGSGGDAGTQPGLAAARALVAAARAISEAAEGAAQWDPITRARVLRELERASGAIATARSRVLVAEEAAATSLRPGDRDFAAARARLSRTGMGEARRELRLAQTLDALPTVAEAVNTGRVPLPHADALARAAASAGARGRDRLTEPSTQVELVALATRLPVKDFAAAAQRLVATFDPPAAEDAHEAQRARRFLHLSHGADGTHVRGLLDRVSGALLRAALDGMGVAPDVDRTKEQADADALVALVERGATGAAGVRRTGRPSDQRAAARWDAEQQDADARVSGVAARPTISVLVPASTVAEITRHRGHAAEDGERASAGGAGVEPAVLEDGTVLPLSVLGRFLCDSELGRIVLDADSVPIDLGRTARLFSAAQRRAVIVRDRGCAWNGCDVPAAYCEVHHIRWWDRHRGRTDLANGVLLCSHHHHTVHRNDLSIVREAPPPPGRAAWAEPQRYRFEDALGGLVNAAVLAEPGG